MKKRLKKVLLLSLTALLLAMPLFAETFPSNSLAQILTESSDGYTLEVEGNTQRLLRDGTAVLITETEEVDGIRTVRETSLPSGAMTVRTYTGNLLTGEDTDEGHREYVYSDDGRLQSVSLSRDGELQSVITYYRSAETGNLLGARIIERDERYSLYATGLHGEDVFAEGAGEDYTRVISFPAGIIVSETVTAGSTLPPLEASFQEDGSLSITSNGITTLFDPEGRLRERDGELYHYKEDGSLDYITYTALENGEEASFTDYYDSLFLARRTIERDGVVLKRIEYRADNTRTEELYDKGTPYARVTYASDGRRIDSVEYL